MAGELSRFNLNQFQTQILLPLETRAAGVYTREMLVEGNSLLSSVFVESGDVGASVEVKYFDFTTGTISTERYDLSDPHPVIPASSSPITDRRSITKIHNKPVVEATVVGGNVKFGVYGTVVSAFASDLDAALLLDGADFDSGTNKGLPVMCYDEVLQKAFVLRCENGVIPVGISEAGDEIHLRYSGVSTPGIEQTLILDTVPVGKERKMTKLYITGRHPGTYRLDDGSDIIASGRIGPGRLVDVFRWEPRLTRSAGVTFTLKFTALSGTPASDVEAYLMASDLSV